MILILRSEEIKRKDDIIRQKRQEGYQLINITESPELISDQTGNYSIPQLILEFNKL